MDQFLWWREFQDRQHSSCGMVIICCTYSDYKSGEKMESVLHVSKGRRENKSEDLSEKEYIHFLKGLASIRRNLVFCTETMGKDALWAKPIKGHNL